MARKRADDIKETRGGGRPGADFHTLGRQQGAVKVIQKVIEATTSD
jgi:hypothetical protein